MIKKLAAAAALLCAWAAASAQPFYPSYDDARRELTLPQVQVGGTTYSDVVVRLDNFSIVAVGQSGPTFGSGMCTDWSFTLEKFDAIQVGMTFTQVSNIMMCGHDRTVQGQREDGVTFRWVDGFGGGKTIWVEFDASGSRVVSRNGISKIKAGF